LAKICTAPARKTAGRQSLCSKRTTATNQLRVAVRSKQHVRRIASPTSGLLEKHFLTDQAQLSGVETVGLGSRQNAH
jgi:hypothetical protein